MTDVELEKKAKLYADEHFADKYEDGNWLSNEDMMSRAYIAGAKELEQENEQLKAQMEKMKNCINCKYFVDSDNVCNQGLYLPNREFTECYEWELAE